MIHINLKNPQPRSLESRIGSDVIQHFNVRIANMRSPDLVRHFEKMMTKDTHEVLS